MKYTQPFWSLILLMTLGQPVAQAEWNVSFLPLIEYGHSINETGLLMDEDGSVKPPFGSGTLGPWAVDLISTSSIVEADTSGGELRIDYTRLIADRLHFVAGFSFGVLDQSVTYDISYHLKYHYYNPFTNGIGGPPVLIGRSDVTVETVHLIPQLTLGTRYALTERVMVSLGVQLGGAFVRYEDYDFFNPIHQFWQVIRKKDQVALYNPKDDWIARRAFMLEFAYQISDRWFLHIRQSFIRTQDYELVNTAESNATIYSLKVHIADQRQHQTAIGVRYMF